MAMWAMSERIIIVGAGLAGLAVAAELGSNAEVELVERLPAVGGTWGFEAPAVRDLVRRCTAVGVRMTIGVTALRWIHGRLLLLGPGIRCWRQADHLFFAGGTRPATPAELPVHGARVAGVFSGTVAHHLLEAQITLGRRVAVCGGGFWADLAFAELAPGTHTTAVGGDHAPGGAASVWHGYAPVEVRGHARVEQLVIECEGQRRTIDCDCVVLAGDQRPLRNVDGAIAHAPDVTYVQLCADRVTPTSVIDNAVVVAGRHGRNI